MRGKEGVVSKDNGVNANAKTPEEHFEDARRSVETAIEQIVHGVRAANAWRIQLEATRIPSAPLFEILDDDLEEFVNAPGPKGDK
jgi:hypothetical protein